MRVIYCRRGIFSILTHNRSLWCDWWQCTPTTGFTYSSCVVSWADVIHTVKKKSSRYPHKNWITASAELPQFSVIVFRRFRTLWSACFGADFQGFNFFLNGSTMLVWPKCFQEWKLWKGRAAITVTKLTVLHPNYVSLNFYCLHTKKQTFSFNKYSYFSRTNLIPTWFTFISWNLGGNFCEIFFDTKNTGTHKCLQKL